MRLWIALIPGLLSLAACAASPRTLCAQSVPDTWEYVGTDAKLSVLLDASLPHAPYETNQGTPVRSVRHVWYRIGDTGLLACTVARGARDNCSVRVTEFSRADGAWSKSREDAVLCNVLVSKPNTQAPRH